jgi:multiple antibiotic resistance protein
MTLYTMTVTLIFVMDPLGNIPIFLTSLNSVEGKRRQYVIIRESLIALLILIFFLFFGQRILEGMHISPPALAISGGIILFLIAIRMIFPQDIEQKSRSLLEPFIVPLAVPLFAGPSTMTMVMLLATQSPNYVNRLLLALLIAWLITTTTLVFADSFRKILGERGLLAAERLMGMVLTTMAVQMFLTGFEQVLHS